MHGFNASEQKDVFNNLNPLINNTVDIHSQTYQLCFFKTHNSSVFLQTE